MILAVHTYYQQNGGEDLVYSQECDLLNPVLNVEKIVYNNKGGIKGFLQFIFSIWNVFAVRELKNSISRFKPALIHIHNLHFAIGPLAIRVAKRAGVPVVVTLHNYRLLCPSATLLYQGEIFADSVKSSFPWKAVRNGVYRNSKTLTFWLAFVYWFHRKIGTWRMVDKYIVLTPFAERQFLQSSIDLPKSKFIVKPNFVNRPVMAGKARGAHFLFVGRLSDEKGISILLKAFQKCNYSLHIAGDGPLRSEIENACKSNSNINYKGNLSHSEVIEAMQQCTALIFPSIWYEGMPMTILESFAVGTPVITSNLGAMSSMIRDGFNGLHFRVKDPGDLLNKLELWASLSPQKKSAYRLNALNTYLTNYTPEENLGQILEIYNSVKTNN
jgi:glycosyltransferase involved in cell wall biosynthesis